MKAMSHLNLGPSTAGVAIALAVSTLSAPAQMTPREVSARTIPVPGLKGNPHTGMCKCPCHDDRTASLHVSKGEKGVVFYCHTGCSQDAVLAALRARGWLTKPNAAEKARRRDVLQEEREDEFKRFRKAMNIMRAASSGEKLATYLKGRGIKRVPKQAMLLSACDARRLTGKRFPALVLPIWDGHLLQGAHVTFLTRDGAHNACGAEGKSVRRSYGMVEGGYIQLAEI